MRARSTVIGTSGFSYKEWKGSFYPQNIRSSEMLRFYAERLPAVELNNTFYRMPRSNVLASWSTEVPIDFRFAVKASRRITHIKRLKDVTDETTYLLKTLKVLGERLGVILFQLPPNLRKDISRFARFFSSGFPSQPVPPSSFDTNRGVTTKCSGCSAIGTSRCASPTPTTRMSQQTIGTASWGYLRLRREAYSHTDLVAWKQRIEEQNWEEVLRPSSSMRMRVPGPSSRNNFLELV